MFNSTPFFGQRISIHKNNVVVDYAMAWSISVTLEMVESSGFVQDWKTWEPAMCSWKGTLEFQFVPGNTEQKAIYNSLITAVPGTKITDIKFILDTDTNSFTGNIYLIGASISPAADSVKCSVSFIGDGPLSLVSG